MHKVGGETRDGNEGKGAQNIGHFLSHNLGLSTHIDKENIGRIIGGTITGGWMHKKTPLLCTVTRN